MEEGIDSPPFYLYTNYATHRRKPMALKRGTMLYLAGIYLAFCFPSEGLAGEELVLREEMALGVPTLLCQKPEDIIEVMELAEMSSNLQEAVEQTEGCGWLQKPAKVKITAIGTFETKNRKYIIARFDFLEVVYPPQYSVVAVKQITKA